MNVKEFYRYIDNLYPKSLSCDWDNDGIMCCADTSASVEKVLVSLDASLGAIEYATANGFDVLLTHHPMIFRKLNAVSIEEYRGNRIVSAISGGVTVMSFHTRLDAGVGGVNDCLVRTLGFEPCSSFGDSDCPEAGRIFELEKPMMSEDFALLCKEKLDASSVRLTGIKEAKRIAVVGGGGGDFIDAAISCGADLLLTGECSYNAAQDAAEQGLAVVEAGHFHTEFPVCERLLQLANECGAQGEIYNSFSCETF